MYFRLCFRISLKYQIYFHGTVIYYQLIYSVLYQIFLTEKIFMHVSVLQRMLLLILLPWPV